MAILESCEDYAAEDMTPDGQFTTQVTQLHWYTSLSRFRAMQG